MILVRIIVVAVLATFILAGLATLRWVFEVWSRGDTLRDDDPSGFLPGNPIIWLLAKSLFLPLFGFINWWQPPIPLLKRVVKRRLEIVGIEHVHEVLGLANHGVIFAVDHRSSADVFMPQIILYLCGLKELAEKVFFYIVGLRFINRNLISLGVMSRDRIPIVPPTMIPTVKPPASDKVAREKFRQQVRSAIAINNAARQWTSRLLKDNRVAYIAPEGTRSRNRAMTQPLETVASLLNQDDVYVLPVALEGTERMWPIDCWPRPLNTVKMLVGRSIHVDEIRRQATYLAEKFGVSFNRAFVDLVMNAIARLHIDSGDPTYAGFYLRPLEEIYEGKTRSGVGKD